MATFAQCDFCDKQMPLAAAKNVSVIRHGDPDVQIAYMDLCTQCFDGLVAHINHCKTNRSAD